MKNVIAICILSLLLPLYAAGSHAQPPETTTIGASSTETDVGALRAVFEEGNASYEDGDFESAIDAYSSLVAAGVENKDLYYNLANAYFKNGELGWAVLYYERALRLAPRDEDTKANLSLVDAMLRDRQFIREGNRFQQAFLWIYRNLTLRESVLLTSLLYVLLCACAVIFILRKTRFVRNLYGRLSVVSPGRFLGLSRESDLLAALVIALILFAASGASAYQKISEQRSHDRSVVVQPEVAVYSGPMEDATLQFKIHEGTRARIRTRQPGWVQIEFPGDLSGWIEADAVEEI